MGPLAGPRLASYSISLDARPDLAELLDSGRPKLFAEDEAHLDTYAEVLDLPDGHSCLAAPIVADGGVIGLLTLDHRTCGVFSKEILRFIEVISRLIAVALSQRSAPWLSASNARS
jgi:transcriptional regulator with GAF, ATPase, and Fis domain